MGIKNGVVGKRKKGSNKKWKEEIRRGAENPFSDIGPQRRPYFLVVIIGSGLNTQFLWE